jgi:hypothetical protein
MSQGVFISYSSKDHSVADIVCGRLEANGIPCWIAPRDIRYGSDWGESIIEAIDGSRVLVLVFSSNANQSPHVKREVSRAVTKQLTILPIRVEDVQPARSLEYQIGQVHWMDAFTSPLEPHIDRLASLIRDLLHTDGTSVPEDAGDISAESAGPFRAASRMPRHAKRHRWWVIALGAGAAVTAVGGSSLWFQPWATRARPAPTTETVPKGSELRREIAERLADHGYSLRVDVRPDRTVALTGIVESDARRDEAVRVARAIGGVTGVDANLRVQRWAWTQPTVTPAPATRPTPDLLPPAGPPSPVKKTSESSTSSPEVPEGGVIVTIDRTATSPTRVKPGDKIDLLAEYTLSAQAHQPSIRIKERRSLLFEGRLVATLEKVVDLSSDRAGSRVSLTVPPDAVLGFYTVETTVEPLSADVVVKDGNKKISAFRVGNP